MKACMLPLVLVVLFHWQACQALENNNVLELGSSLNTSSPPLHSPSSTFILSFLPSSSSSSSSDRQYYLTISYPFSPDHPVWTANRLSPVPASATLTLSSSGELMLFAYPSLTTTPVWSSRTGGRGVVSAQLLDSGNLILVDSNSSIVWQSFANPTDTLLPGQPFNANLLLNSASRVDSLAPGRYILSIDSSTGILKLSNTSSSSSYWDWGNSCPSPQSVFLQFDQLGNISLYSDSPSNVQSTLIANDYGSPMDLRRLTLDIDGNLRMYTWDSSSKKWKSVWLAFTDVCVRVLELCGSYGVCKYDPQPKCACPSGFSVVDSGDWSRGCRPNDEISSCDGIKFLAMEGLDYPGNDYRDFMGATEEGCKTECAKECACRAAVYWQNGEGHCVLKKTVQNGYRTTTQLHRVFLKISNSTGSVPAAVFDSPTQWTSHVSVFDNPTRWRSH